MTLQALLRGAAPPIAFTYEGRPFPEGFTVFHSGTEACYAHTSGLSVRVCYETYPDAEAVEWTVWLENTGSRDTGLIQDLHALSWTIPDGESCWLEGSKGTQGKIDDFTYFRRPIEKGETETLRSHGSQQFLPFANLDCGGNGLLIGLGWTGHWQLTVCREPTQVHITAGMPETRFVLHPGERVRSPRVLLLSWAGESIAAHNALRRHLVRHHIPKGADGEPCPGICCSAWGGMQAHNHRKQIAFIAENRLPYDIYWIDAGWYGGDHDTSEFEELDYRDWAYKIGDWRVNRRVYPDGIGAIADAVHAAGMKLLLWCSAFQCVRGVGWQAEHPDWGVLDEPSRLGSRLGPETQTAQMYLDDPAAAAHLAKTIRDVLRESKADYLREDTPLPIGHPDAPDRIGIGEMKAVEAFYAYWDALRESRPGMIIDNCGGGGRRLDLETLSRSYCFWRSDYNCFPGADPIGAQAGNYGLGFWIPLVSGAARTENNDTYAFRSGLNGGMPFNVIKPNADVGEALDCPVDWYREMMEQFQRVKPCLSGDFYPLTDCDVCADSVMAYQLDRPDKGMGAIFAFRRQACGTASFPVLPVLPEGTRYVFQDLDNRTEWIVTGGDALTISIETAPGSRLLLYRLEA